jgi:AcrR family transcriptional regulator
MSSELWHAVTVATRRYEQRVRAEQADQTKRAILDAVGRRLREAPTEPLSLDQVARLAGVARSTIYLVFGSRAGVFDAFAQDLWARTGLPALTKAVADPDARGHLRGGITAASRMYDGDLGIYRVLHAMGRLDPDSVGGALATMERERGGGMEFVARHLAEDGILADGITVDEATNVLWVLCSFEAFDLLRTDRGLSLDDAIETIVTSAERALCRPS